MSDRWMGATAVAVAGAALWGRGSFVWAGLVLLLAFAARSPALLVVGLVLLVGARAAQSQDALLAPLPAHVAGVAQLVDDPRDAAFGTQVTLRLDGRRYLTTVPFADSGALDGLLTGDRLRVSGRPRPIVGAPPGWVRSRHLAGRLDPDEVAPAPGTPLWYRVANAVHRTITAGASSMGEDRAALYSGLVLGDDRAQTELTRFRFQAAGLTHLLAVSGQNVAFLLAVLAPLLRRLGPWPRVVAGIVALGAFVLVTRAEPSVLRAAAMAAIALLAVGMGRAVPPVRVLSLAVVLLLVVDPLLVHSVGFRLSIAATAGLLFLTRPLVERLPGPPWCTLPLAVTLAAQLATAPLLLGLGGGLPAVATPANLLAVPAAGVVMMSGVTVGLLAGLVREPVARILQVPADLLVRWIDGVATVASRAPLPVLGAERLVWLAAGVALVWVVRRRRSSGRSGTSTLVVAGLAALCLLAACRPTTTAVGRYVLADGAELRVGECGARVVVLGSVTDQRAVLEGLWRRGVRRVDVVAVSASSRGVRAAEVLARQFGVRRVVTAAERAPPGVEPLAARTVTVGGLRVDGPHAGRSADSSPSTSTAAGTVPVVSEAPCTF